MTVKIIVPIYKCELSLLELKSLRQLYSTLSNYPIVIVKPESLVVDNILAEFPRLEYLSFNDSYFKGIGEYNRLMLSPEFYKAFLATDYILIYQLDAYVFRDELSEWCGMGYDYIGAPWLKKPVYNLPVVRKYMETSHHRKLNRGEPSKQSLYDKIGNGGFSLRKVESHYNAAIKYSEKVDYFLSQKRSHFYNEDVFWATEVPEFNYPEVSEAISFSFDKYPSLCYKLNGRRLPFGCHGWYKWKMRGFWRKKIGF